MQLAKIDGSRSYVRTMKTIAERDIVEPSDPWDRWILQSTLESAFVDDALSYIERFLPRHEIPFFRARNKLNIDCRPIQTMLASLKPSLTPYKKTGRSPIAIAIPHSPNAYFRRVLSLAFRRNELNPILGRLVAHGMDVTAEGLHDTSLPITPHYSTPIETPGVLVLVIYHSRDSMSLALVYLNDGETDTIRTKELPYLGSSQRVGNATAVEVIYQELNSISKPMTTDEITRWKYLGIDSNEVKKVVLVGDDTGNAELKDILRSTLNIDLVEQTYKGLAERNLHWGNFSSAIGAAWTAQEWMSVNWMEVKHDEL
jgi:hypothetical protein